MHKQQKVSFNLGILNYGDVMKGFIFRYTDSANVNKVEEPKKDLRCISGTFFHRFTFAIKHKDITA